MLKKLVSVLLACILCIGIVVPVGADSIFDTAVPIELGGKITDVGRKLDYKFIMPEDGVLSVNYMYAVSAHHLYVYDANGNQIKVTSCNIITGRSSGGAGYDYLTGYYNDVTKQFKAECTYKLKKGTYYFRFTNIGYAVYDGTLELTFTAKIKEPAKPKIDYLTVNLTQGKTLQLGAVLSKAGTVKWSSSKTSVATVSSKGKVTAKKKGSAVITAKCGDSSQKIKVVVK